MDKRIALKKQKVNRKTSVNKLIKEMYRDEETAPKYDNGNRNLSVERTKDNIILKEIPDDLDSQRKRMLDEMDEKRKEENIDNGRRLRSDTVDVMSYVVQLSAEYCASKDDKELAEDYQKVYEMMNDKSEIYGEVYGAVIHFDETTPHMQILSSTIDKENARSKAKLMMGGNKTGMSEKQTEFVEHCIESGLDVERGIKRVDTTYTKQKAEFEERFGYRLTRHNEKIGFDLMKKADELDALKNEVEDAKQLAIDDIQVRDSSHKVPEKKLKKVKEDEQPEPVHTEVGREQHARLNHAQLLTMVRDLRLKQAKELEEKAKQREEMSLIDRNNNVKEFAELRRRTELIEEREHALDEREGIIQEEEEKLEIHRDRLSKFSNNLDDRANAYDAMIDELNAEERRKDEGRSAYEKVGKKIEEDNPEMFEDTLITANREMKERQESRHMPKVPKPPKKAVRRPKKQSKEPKQMDDGPDFG